MTVKVHSCPLRGYHAYFQSIDNSYRVIRPRGKDNQVLGLVVVVGGASSMYPW